MEFCPRCNMVMILKKKSDNSIFFCPKCGYEKKVEELVVVNVVKKRSKPSLVLIEEEGEKVLPTTTDVVCPNCGNKEAFWWSIQTRSADEPMTLFFRCTKCNHTWREYG